MSIRSLSYIFCILSLFHTGMYKTKKWVIAIKSYSLYLIRVFYQDNAFPLIFCSIITGMLCVR